MKKIVTVDGEALTVDGEAVETDDEETMSEYNIGAGLRLDAGTNTLSVNAASTVEEGNTNPVMSTAVWELIGNLSDLTTTAKNNLVAAINEAAKTGSGGAGSIDLRTADGYIQYSNDGGATWENLIALADLKGEKGDTGAPGPQGVPGEQGPQGETGPAGPQGKTGPAGQDGAPGKDGSPGKDGADGAPGQDGFSPSASVAKTATGATITITDKTGTTTAEIKNGKDGAPGKDGTNGKDGAPGADGAPGTPGANGTDGKDGTTFTPSVSAAGDLSWTNDGGKDNPAPVNLKGPPGADYTLTAADKTEIAAEVIAGGVEAQLGPVSLPAPSAADVGQIVKIKAVDAAGKITQTEAVDLPSGGGSGDTWELINFIKIADDAEEAIGLTIDKDSSGKAFSLSRFRLIALSPIYTGETEIPNFCFASINGRKSGSLQSEQPMVYTGLQMPSKTVPTAWAWAEGYLSGNGAWELEYLVRWLSSSDTLSEDLGVIADKRYGNDIIKLGAATVSDRPKLYPITSVGFDTRPVYAGCMFWLYGTRI